MFFRRRLMALVGLLIGSLAAPAVALAAPDDLQLVSRGYDGRPGSSSESRADSWPTGISDDGTVVGFFSNAPNIVRGASGPHVYVRDVADGATTLVDRQDGVDGEPSRDPAFGSLSADGRYVVFAGSFDGNHRRVYRRDLTTNTTELASRVDGPDGAAVDAYGGLVSANGRYVTFTAYRQGVTDDPESEWEQLYVRDMASGRTVLVSRGNGEEGEPTQENLGSATGISAGGRYVVFRSADWRLDPTLPQNEMRWLVWMRDLRTHRTLLVSRADGVAGAAAEHSWAGATPVISGGCRVAFDARGHDLAPGSPPDGGMQSYVRDLCAGTTTLVSRQSGANGTAADVPRVFGPGGNVMTGGMDASGTRVLFSAASTNLAPGTTRSRPTAYVRDLATNTTTLVSRAAGPDGAPDQGGAFAATIDVLNADGRFALFGSAGDGLDPDIDDQWVGYGMQVFRREAALPATSAAVPCGPLDDPGLGGPASLPCAAGQEPASPVEPSLQRPVVTVPAGDAGSAAGASGPAAPVASTPTFVYRPRLQRVRVTKRRLTAFLDVAATVTVVIERRRGTRHRRVGAPLLEVAKAGRVRLTLPRLRRGTYRLTVRAAGQAGTTSAPIRRSLEIRPKRARR